MKRFGKISKRDIVLFVVLLSMMLVFASSLPVAAKVAIFIALAVVYFYSKREELLFNKGVGFIQSNKPKEALECFEKSLKGELKQDQRLVVAAVFIQHGKVEEGLTIVQTLLDEGVEQRLRIRALVLQSLAYWNLGRRDEAIVLLEGLVDDGFEDENTMSSLCVYLLVSQRFDEAKRYLCAKDLEDVSSGMLDNYLWLYIALEDWTKSSEVVDEIEKRSVDYPEAYFHMAIVHLVKGQKKSFEDCMEECLQKKFVPNAVISHDFVQKVFNLVLTEDAFESAKTKLVGHYSDLARGDVSVLALLDCNGR